MSNELTEYKKIVYKYLQDIGRVKDVKLLLPAVV